MANMSAELQSGTGREEVPDWVDLMHQRRQAAGFEARAVIVVPDQPVSRTVKYYTEGTYDYNGRILPYATAEDARHAEHNRDLTGHLRRIYGSENVDTINLPSGYDKIDPTYPDRVHRLVMVNPRTIVRDFVKMALSDGPRSPSEAMTRPNQETKAA